MKKWLIATLALIMGWTSLQAQSVSPLEAKLYGLPDVIFEETQGMTPEQVVYKCYVKQPIDHTAPEKGHFYQKVYLLHAGYDRPTVINTSGYSSSRFYPTELSMLLQANQLMVEHRFFGESMPETLDYQYLTMEQATADLHHVRELFGQIYDQKWISTGVSKGGMTTIIYRYFYPEDVDVSVPYVAPINQAFEEPRIYEFLDTVGTAECRDAIMAFQKRMLKKRKEVLPLLKAYAKGAKLEFDYLTLEQAFEFAVLEYSFSFWQWGSNCADIPEKSASIEEQVEYLLDVSGIDFFADQSMVDFASHYYQSANQLGYYGYETEDFKGLLKALPMQPHPHAAFTPDSMEVKYDGTLLDNLHKWFATGLDQFIFIYGANDTWSASAVQPVDGAASKWYFMEGKHHGNARIYFMTREEKQEVFQTLSEWLEIPVPAVTQ
ncbi:S28 family serine protease [Pontibacter sp. G13]|uniref:S28 family serine protease n=1 Tax=Pontibacter sp. G13 TaxID=3074898 RepID=UPI00288AC062|nr:S28 family serine protease [Pontibacter sp. G13]WNJ20204.1 S28 family serine protease [Pontibacter sp. G13]